MTIVALIDSYLRVRESSEGLSHLGRSFYIVKGVRLYQSGLVLAASTEESTEALASSRTVVANTTSRAISTSFISKTIQRISARRAFLQVASRSSVTQVTQASNVFHRVPRSGVCASHFGSQMLLGPAGTTVIAVVGADSALASNTIISREALAQTSLAVTETLVGAFSDGMQIILVDDAADPRVVMRTGAQ